MSLSARDQQRLDRIEAELSGERRLADLASWVGKPAARWQRMAVVALLWIGLPVCVCGTGGLVAALVLHLTALAGALVVGLALLWPAVVVAVWRRRRVPR